MGRVKTRQKPPLFAPNMALRQVREATGLSQKRFGEAVSLNPSTLQNTEDGDRLLKGQEAELIMSFTGALVGSLLKGTKATTLDGRPYSRRAFQQWQQRGVPKAAVEAAARRAGQFVEAMIIAAHGERDVGARIGADETQAGPLERPQRYREFVDSLWRQIGKLLKNYGLQERMESELEKRAVVETKQMNVEALQKLLAISDGGYSPDGWDREKIAKIPPQRLFNTKIARHPMFSALTGLSAVDGKAAFADALLLDKLTVGVNFPWLRPTDEKLTAFIFTAWVNMQSHVHHEERTIQIVGGLKRRKKRPTS
jgi:hypothetical protein